VLLDQGFHDLHRDNKDEAYFTGLLGISKSLGYEATGKA
jgi:hypothetical protein